MNKILLEDRRSQLLSKAKIGDPYVPWNQYRGKNRYNRRLFSKLAASVQNFNSIDMNKFFKDDILDVDIDVKGETNNYVVRISFAGTLDEIHNFMKTSNQEKIDRKIISKAVVKAFNGSQVYIRCNCPDFRYRHAYWATRNNLIIGSPEDRPSDITNPNDTKGPACKHVTLALNDSSWLIKVSSVIYNYIDYMEQHDKRLYQKYIYPAIYQKPWSSEDEVQLDITDIETNDARSSDLDIRFSEYQELVDDEVEKYGSISDTTYDLIADAGLYVSQDEDGNYIVSGNKLDKSNALAKEKGKFKSGNEYRFTKPDNEIDDDQIAMDLS